MSSQSAEIKEAVRLNLLKFADPVLSADGFRRTPKALIYARQGEYHRQKIEIHLELNPTDNPNSVAAIYPWLEHCDARLEEFVNSEFSPDERTAMGVRSASVRQPMDVMVPGWSIARWYLYQPDSVETAIREFVDTYNTVVARFLAELCETEFFVRSLAFGAPQLLPSRKNTFLGAAGFLLLGDRKGAAELVETKFSAKALKRQYMPLFSRLEVN